MKREHYLDVAKGIAMILVVLGHITGIPGTLYFYINSFHMPLFFILSGIVYNPLKYTKSEFVKKKIKTLFIPYVLLNFVLIAINFGIFNNADFSIKKVITKVVGIFIANRKTDYYSNLWYILATFIAEIALYFVINLIYKYAKKKKTKNIILSVIAIAFSVLGYFLNTKIKTGIIFNLDLVSVAISFILFGYIIRENIEHISKLFNKLFIPLFIILHLIFAMINNKIFGGSGSLFNASQGNYFVYILGALCGTFMVLCISKAINESKVLEYIGRNTLVIYAFQKAVALKICYIVYDIIISKVSTLNNIYFKIPFCLVLSSGILFLIVECVNRYLPFLICKKKEKVLNNAK